MDRGKDFSRTLLLFVSLGLVYIFIAGIEQVAVRPSPGVPIVVPQSQ